MVQILPHATCLSHQIKIDDLKELGIQPFKLQLDLNQLHNFYLNQNIELEYNMDQVLILFLRGMALIIKLQNEKYEIIQIYNFLYNIQICNSIRNFKKLH